MNSLFPITRFSNSMLDRDFDTFFTDEIENVEVGSPDHNLLIIVHEKLLRGEALVFQGISEAIYTKGPIFGGHHKLSPIRGPFALCQRHLH